MPYRVQLEVDGSPDRPVVLVLHGFLGSTRWFDRLVPLLSPEYRVVRAGLLGHGGSAPSDRGYAPGVQAAAIVDALVTSGVAAAAGITVVGHSLGADVAVAVAELAQLPITGLVLIDEAADYTTFAGNAAGRILRAPIIGPLLHRALPAVLIRQSVRAFFAPHFEVASAFDAPDQVVTDFRAVSYDCFVDTQESKERFVAEKPLDARLADLRLPALIVFGVHDQIFRAAPSAERYRRAPGVKVRVIDGAGHSPILEKPDVVAELITAFVGADRLEP